MTFIGADTDQLRDLSGRMRAGMLRLQEQQSQIMRAVSAARAARA
jgi:hypothetical protein